MNHSRIIIRSTALVFFGGLLCLAYSYFIEPGRIVVNQYEIRIKDWNPSFDGLRIALISDIHAGSNSIDEAKLHLIVEMTNEQNPDVIVLLGDYISQNRENKPINERSLKMEASVMADNLAGLRAKHGVFAVLGNHDGWYGDAEIAAELRRIGYTVLQNEIAIIQKDGSKLRLLGLKDHLQLDSWQTFDSSVRKIVAANEAVGDIIVLEHSPDVFHVLNYFKTLGRDLKLTLAGHTHGGQVWLPVLGSPVVPTTYGQKYAYGHIKEEGSDMFVTSGIGTSILPFRFMVPPEIAVVTIRSDAEY